MTAPMLQIEDLRIDFPHRLRDFTAVTALDMTVRRGEIVGLIGESGAGKSTVGNAIMRLLAHPGKIAGGRILLDGEDLVTLSDRGYKKIRGRKVGMIFQDPMTSLNPLMTVGDQLSESIALEQGISRDKARNEAKKRLADVGIPDVDTRVRQYPHEFSGGMRQRVVIALALAGDPELLIADEPTTALDVSVQKQVLDLIKRLCRDRDLGVILVTHDMGVIAETADRVYVLRHGKLVETGPTAATLGAPKADYTRTLIAAIPRIDRREARFHDPAERHTEIDKWLLQGHEGREPRDDYLTTTPLVRDFVVRSSGFAGARSVFRAVDVPALTIRRGEVLGLVGESGSGKSTLGKILTGLLPVTDGRITVTDHGPLDEIRDRTRRKALRRDIQVVFQDPYSSLNGRMRVDHILSRADLVPRTCAQAQRAHSGRPVARTGGAGCLGPAANTRTSFPAGSASASASPGRSRCGHGFCCATSRPRHWTYRFRPTC